MIYRAPSLWRPIAGLIISLLVLQSATGQRVRQAKHPVPESPLWLTYPGEEGPGKGKLIVLRAFGRNGASGNCIAQ